MNLAAGRLFALRLSLFTLMGGGAILGIGSTVAQAAKPAGVMYLSTKSFPVKATSENALRAASKKLSTKLALPTDSEAVKEWSYALNFIAFFGKALDGSVVTVTVYDVTDKTLRLITTFEQDLFERGLRSYRSQLTFKHPDQDVRPNRKYLVVLSSRSGKIAEAEFTALGKTPKLSGKIEFTAEETR